MIANTDDGATARTDPGPCNDEVAHGSNFLTLWESALEVGFARFFCFWAASMDATIARIWQLAAPLAETQGMEIIDIEFRHEGSRGGRVLRLYLDKPGGPNVDDLSRMSRDLSELLDADE